MCQFPSRLLLNLMRQVARDADASHDLTQMTYAAGYIKATGDLRLYHEDITGCQCWLEAIKETDEVTAKRAVRSERARTRAA